MADTNETASRPLIARVLLWVGGIVLIAVLVLGAARFFIPTISPVQEQPPGHYFKPCVTCHLTVAGSEFIDVE